MKLVRITHTDMWQSTNSQRFVGLAFSLSEALELARQDKDAMKDVQSKQGHIVFDWVTVGELESEERIGATDSDYTLEQLFGDLPKGWVKINEYGAVYTIHNDYIYQIPLPETELILASECDITNEEAVQCDESAFSEEEEYEFMENVMTAFDIEPWEVMTLIPIKNFTQETLQKFKEDYVG